MKETSRMLVSSFAAAIVFLLLFLFFHWNLIVCILLCVGIYFGLFFLLKPSRKIAELMWNLCLAVKRSGNFWTMPRRTWQTLIKQ